MPRSYLLPDNLSKPESMMFNAYKAYGITPVSLPLKHLPACYNFTNTVPITYTVLSIESRYPNIPLIGISRDSSLFVPYSSGSYKVVVGYISLDNGGTFSISNGTYSLDFSTASLHPSLNYTYLGKIYLKNGFYLRFNGNSPSFLGSITLISEGLHLGGNFTALSIKTIPSPSAPFGRITEHKDVNYYFYPILINSIVYIFTLIWIALELGKRNHVLKGI
ncbi:hypothetical protein [Acidianus sp. RZ1]|uniref:hypothetical protein n=1 Tax=Acidianus sp. RZ1 TaxID=1540082 RepID=UPI001490E61A|nr:hypothetical protein [Acidianus sp. RZ1]NON61543.1 hypothetical protein [Acidianus sp. RZ1]